MALQPAFGHLYTDYSVKAVYIIVIEIFEIGSVICRKPLLSDVSLREAEGKALCQNSDPGGLHGANPEKACIHIYRYEYVSCCVCGSPATWGLVHGHPKIDLAVLLLD